MRKISIILKAFIIIIALILVHSADAKDDVTAFSEQMKSTIVRIDYIPIGDWNDPPILCYMVESHYGLFSQHVNVWKDGRIAWFDALKGPAPVDDPQVKVGLYYYKSVLPRESIKNIMAKIIKARANNSLRNSKIRRQIPFVSDMCHAYFIDSEEFLADEKWSSLLVTQYQCNRNEILEFMKRNEISDAIDAFGRTLNYDKSFFTKTYADIAASMKDKGVTENEISAACFKQFIKEIEFFLIFRETIENLIPDVNGLVSQLVPFKMGSSFPVVPPYPVPVQRCPCPLSLNEPSESGTGTENGR